MTGVAAKETTETLLARARTGDRDALRCLLAPHEEPIFRFCVGMLTHAADAEDAAQETLLAAVRALNRPGGFRGESALRTWLIRIARNVCLSRLRRKPRGACSPESWETLALADHNPGPEETVVRRAVLHAALARLTAGQRAALTLQAVEGWSVREIADALKVPEKRVENDLYRARRALAKWREEWEGEHGS